MADLKRYLAEKYMSGPKADAILSNSGPPSKKKKRKAPPAVHDGGTRSAMVVDDSDNASGLGPTGRNYDLDADDPDSQAVVASDRSFKKRKTQNNWTRIHGPSEPVKEDSPPPQPDEQPIVVQDDNADDQPFAGGLVPAKQLKKVLPSAQQARQDTITEEERALAQETVYRDSTGRKIDTKAAKAEAARLKRLKEEKDAERMEWGKGLVQRADAEKMKAELEKQRGKAFRSANDEQLNEELKAKELWNDPAAQFLTKKKSKGPRRPEYTGPMPPPNRFGIKPGYRWDGVDRGNGFEKKFFQSQNERKRQGAASHAWSVEDM
jgi:pre-mRNA-splicing factor CWC26